MQICLASRNAHKIQEINKVIPPNIEVFGLDKLAITEDIPETGDTFYANAEQKAKYIFDKFKVPVFADDSGLSVNSLGGAPGIFSARYAGEEKNDQKNIELLLENLVGIADRSAYFITVICYIDSNGDTHFFEGKIHGEIISEQKGSNGFGYDPVFVPSGITQTFAELASEEKNKISHRAKATEKFIDFLSQ